jgi:sRNA-binding carbon storage regulator CsrA
MTGSLEKEIKAPKEKKVHREKLAKIAQEFEHDTLVET